MNCEHVRNRLTDYYFHELESAEAAEVREHLERCASCRAELAHLEAAARQLKAGMDVTPLSEEEILDTVRKARALPDAKPRPAFWVWAPAAAVLLVGFLVVNVVRYGQKETAPAAFPMKAPLAQENMKKDKLPAAQSPVADQVAKQKGNATAFEESVPAGIGGKESALDNKHEATGGLAPAKPASEAEARKSRGAVQDKIEARRNEVQSAMRDAEGKPVDDFRAPAAAPAQSRPVQAPMQELSATGKVQASDADRQVSSKKTGEKEKAGDARRLDRPREEALLKDTSSLERKDELGMTAPASPRPVVTTSYDLTRDCLKKGILPPADSIRVEDFATAFPKPYSEEVRRIAEAFGQILKTPPDMMNTTADVKALAAMAERELDARTKEDPKVKELIGLIKETWLLKSRTSPVKGTQGEEFSPEQKP